MKVRFRRHVLAAPLVLLAAVTVPASPARAFPVFDGSRFAALINSLTEMANLYEALQGTLSRLERAGKTLGSGRLLDGTLLVHRQLTSDVRTIGYRLQTVSDQYNRVFPTEEAIQNTTPAESAALARGWNQEIHQASLVAARSQTTLSQLEANTRSTAEIVRRAAETEDGGEGSHLAKLQALVQIIGVLNSDLQNLSTALAATERVNTSIAASQASSRALAAERSRRTMRNYSRPSRSRGLDRRFLGEGG